MSHTGFSPKARWDTHIPENGNSYNPCEINERIKVLAWFQNGKIIPRMFTWNNTNFKIKEITYNWQERQGREVINYFSVNTGLDIYQIAFNNTTYGWRINRKID